MARFFATAARGTEGVLAAELSLAGIAPVEPARGGVSFGATLEHAYRACLWSRVASRVLMPLAEFEVDGAEALYAGVHAVDWPAHIDSRRTLAVDAAGGRSPAGPPHFVVLKTKDAIVNRLREETGSRPSVDKLAPDLRINVHLSAARVTVSLDLAGGSLHRRGGERAAAPAPLKENLAAAVLRLAGWSAASGTTPLFDPLCGSGTLLLEAAAMARDLAPGLARARFGAEGWLGHDRALWRALRDEAESRRAAALGRPLCIAGSDASPAAVRAARENVERAGFAAHVRIERRDLADVVPPWDAPGLVVTNPPYGARLGEAGELGPLYESLGDILRRRFPGWTAWVLTGNPALAKRLGLKPAARHVLFNGPIECRLLSLPISTVAVTGEKGPGWRRPSAEAGAFERKLRRNLREMQRLARREELTCYRVYDADIPEYNVAVNWYEGTARVEEYEPPAKVPTELAERRLRDVLLVVPEVLGVDPAQIVLRLRRRRRPGEQHERRDDRQRLHEVREGDLRFLVNLTDYLDTGLFLDDRLLRRRIREAAAGRDVLNLFAHTCTATVAAARGGARSTTSVNLSNGYLRWGRRNLAHNGLDEEAHRLVRADVLQWLERGTERGRYGLIYVTPPTYSKSKAMRGDFDVQRDQRWLVERCARLLAPGGRMLFTTNLRRFTPDWGEAGGLVPREITAEITPPDFARRPRLRAWELVREESREPASAERRTVYASGRRPKEARR